MSHESKYTPKYKNNNRVIEAKQNTKQTSHIGGDFSDKLRAYRDLHAHALFSSLGRLVASRLNAVLTIIVLSISISLACGFYLLVENVQQLTSDLESSNQISLFLRDDVSLASANRLANGIKLDPSVQTVKVITKEQALKEFEDFSGFGEAVRALEKNPLPIVLQVIPKNSLEEGQNIETLVENFKQAGEVDFAQLDMQWVKRLQLMIQVAQVSVALLGVLLSLAVLFITGNTIRLELHNRKDEIVIAKLVGATNSFVQRPFLYSGFWIGFFSGISAWFIVTIMMLILKQPVEKLSMLYHSSFHLLFMGFFETLALIFISSALGIVGSWVVVQLQLKQLKV
ncbi:MAG: permease-like cell division protein FtsX [Methylococcales bacterium]|nr:permease-like cell division protein FtsX [Methylococcales bacterium]MDD5754489.1 permease-like cell division protein FtsX [Methylococcales bacterium]